VRVLVCPDSFGDTLSAVEAAQAIAEGWRQGAPDDDLSTRPLADGGPGFLAVVQAAIGGDLVAVPTVDPLGRPVTAAFLLAGQTGYVESAQACGLHLLAPAERDPKTTTTYGLGALVTVAVESGVREVVVGLGGSGTNDGGAGMLAALGAAPLDAAGYVLPVGGAALAHCVHLGGVPRLRDVTLVAASDVDNPLTGVAGASAVFGPQKGATPHDVMLLDAALAHFGAILTRDLPSAPADLVDLPGAGAAGGLGAAILGCGGRRVSGIGLVRELTGLDTALAGSDLVITGEGKFDEQSLRGKVVAGVAAAARDQGVPCVVLAGQVAVDPAAAGVAEAHSLVDHFGSVEEALQRPAEGLQAIAARLAREWRRPRS
jgi:glycerate kinase